MPMSYPTCNGTFDWQGVLSHDSGTCPVHEFPDGAALYATLDTVHGWHRVRVGELVSFHDATDQHDALHKIAGTQHYDRNIVYPEYSVYGRPVRFLSVRGANDPNWPILGPNLPLRDDRTGTIVNR